MERNLFYELYEYEYSWKENWFYQIEHVRIEKESWTEKIKIKSYFVWAAKSDPAGDEDLMINFIPL